MAYEPLATELLAGSANRGAAATPRPMSKILRRALCMSSKGLVTLDPVDTMLDRLDYACAQRTGSAAA